MEANARLIPAGADIYSVSYGDDTGNYVEFYMNAVKDEKASLEQGRPIFKEREYIRIMPIGDKTKKIDRPVRFQATGNVPSDLDRFPRQWQSFKNQGVVAIDGTPIEEWPPLTKSDAMALKAMNIHTVEVLAGLGDNNLTWLGARQMRDKAKAWLDSSKGGAVALKQAQEIEDLKLQVEALTNQLNGLPQVKAESKKRGRKQNVQNPA